MKKSLDHPIIMETLKAAGWYEGRTVPIDDWVAALTADGYTVFPSAADIWREFGGLIIRPPFLPNAAFLSEEINFDPLYAGLDESDKVFAWAKALGKGLCPIGEWENMVMLLVAEDCSVYADCLGRFQFLGENIYLALRLMILREQRPETLTLW
jgi:hypothetical protein